MAVAAATLVLLGPVPSMGQGFSLPSVDVEVHPVAAPRSGALSPTDDAASETPTVALVFPAGVRTPLVPVSAPFQETAARQGGRRRGTLWIITGAALTAGLAVLIARMASSRSEPDPPALPDPPDRP